MANCYAEPSRFWRSKGTMLLDPGHFIDRVKDNLSAATVKPNTEYQTPGLARKFADRRPFRAGDFVKRHGQDPVDKNSGVEAVCPNEAAHSDGGDSRRTLFALNPASADNGHASIRCRHATCQASLKTGHYIDLILQQCGLGPDAVDEFFEGQPADTSPEGEFKDILRADRKRKEAAAAPAVKTLVSQKASEIVPAPVQWLWPGRLALGAMTLFAGDPGIGKSQIAVAMAAAVTTGGPWPCGGGRPLKGSVILLSAEDAPSEVLRPRLDAAGADPSKVELVRSVTVVEGEQDPQRRMLDLAADMALLEDAIRKTGDVRLVIIDPVTAYLGKSSKARYSNTELRGVLDPLSEMASRMKVAVLCVSHFRKPGADFAGKALHAVIDSIAYVAAARIVLGGIKDPEDEARVLMLHLKNNLAPPPAGLAARIKPRVIGAGIETTAVEWEAEPVAVKADDIMGRKGSDGATATGDAAEFLRLMLASGPVDVKIVEQEARGAGVLKEGQDISQSKAFRHARKKLGIVPRKLDFGGGWVWALPTAAVVEFEDVQNVTGSPDQFFKSKLH